MKSWGIYTQKLILIMSTTFLNKIRFQQNVKSMNVMTEIQSQITNRQIFNDDIDLLIVLGDRYESLAVALSAF